MTGGVDRFDGGGVPQAGAAELRRVGVEHRGPGTREGCAHIVALAVDGREVAHHDERAALPVPAEKGHGVGGVVVGAQPLEALPGVILLPEGGLR